MTNSSNPLHKYLPLKSEWNKPHKKLEKCVIAFGIPTQITTECEFKKVIKNACQNNAANHKSFICQFSNWKSYKSFISRVNAFESILTQIGVTVIHDLKFDEFGDLFENYEVIVLFSHNAASPNDPARIEFQDMRNNGEKCQKPMFLKELGLSPRKLHKLFLAASLAMRCRREQTSFLRKNFFFVRILFLARCKVCTFPIFKDLDSLIAKIPSDYSGFIDFLSCKPTANELAAIRERGPDIVVRGIEKHLSANIQLYYCLCLFIQMYCDEISYLEASDQVTSCFIDISD